MKLSKKVGLIIGAVILVAALVGLYTVYSRQTAERNDLTERLESAQTLLPGLTVSKGDLEDELASAQSSLAASQAKFPEAIKSIEYGEDFFKTAYGQNLYAIAGGCGVELTDLGASPPTSKAVGAITYSVSSFTLGIKGPSDSILKFIDAIGTGIDYEAPFSFQLPWSVDVKTITVNVGGGSATISLDIYGYKG